MSGTERYYERYYERYHERYYETYYDKYFDMCYEMFYETYYEAMRSFLRGCENMSMNVAFVKQNLLEINTQHAFGLGGGRAFFKHNNLI